MTRFFAVAAAAFLFVGAGNLYAQCAHGEHSGDKHECAKGAACCAAHGETKVAATPQLVDRTQLQTLISEKAVTVIDARDAESYAEGHIDGAINYKKVSLPADKATKLVFYCGGVRCPAAERAAKEVIAQGYTNVMVYKGGWAEWSES